MSTTVPALARPAAAARLRHAPPLALLNLVLLAAVIVAMTLLLWPRWQDNPDLSHGYFMPLVFLFLLHEARSGTPRFLAGGAGVHAGSLALFVLALLTLSISGAYAAAVDWSSDLVAFTLTASGVCLLGGSLFVFAHSAVRLVPFNWSACVAIGLWLLCAPIPPGTYTRLTIGLQLMVTENVLRALHVLGIAAQRHGNIIELATTSVGVEDACSGVRSLISCVFAGLFFSATLVQRFWPRVLVIGLAAPLALVMNFARSLALTLLANGGIDITGPWHDWTGFAVLGLTAALLAGLALLLERKPAPRPPPPDTGATESPSSRSRRALHLPLTATIALTLGLTGFFVANTRPSIRQDVAIPDLAAILPTTAESWHVDTSREVYQFTATLRTNHLTQRTYLRRTPAGVDQITIYLAYWPAGQAPVSLVASHTPDACWPGAGWTVGPVPRASEPLQLDGRILAGAETRFFFNGQIPQHVWFWHLYDGRPLQFLDPYSATALLEIALRYGFRRGGDQLFVRVSSNRPWETISSEPLIKDVFARLQPLGL